MKKCRKQQELRTKCIEKAEYLNTCHNYKDGENTQYLLDIDSRENAKLVQWSHLYSIMAFKNMAHNTEFYEIPHTEIYVFDYHHSLLKQFYY